MVLNYNDVITELTNKCGFPKNKFFIFEGTSHEDKCAELFDFFQNSFQKDFSSLGIESAYFFYNNIEEVNGYASRKGNCYVVCFKIGAVKEISSKLGDLDLTPYHKNEKPILEDFKRLYPEGTNKLVYSSAMMYFFYHEVGHLVQFKSEEKDILHMEKKEENKKIYTNKSHVREIDADMFAAIQLSRQILNRLDKLQDPDANTISTLFGIYLSGPILFNLFLLPIRDFYTTANSHPHAFVRVMCILYSLQTGIRQKYPNLNIDDLINDSLEIALKIVDDLIGHENGSNYEIGMKKMFCKNENDIKQYSKRLIDQIPTMKNSAVNEYNRSVRALNK